jgi:hypothetical protein
MKLLITQFSPTSCHLIFLRSIYSPQHSSLRHPQSVFLPQCQRPSFTPIRNNRQNYSFVYYFYVFTGLHGVIPQNTVRTSDQKNRTDNEAACVLTAHWTAGRTAASGCRVPYPASGKHYRLPHLVIFCDVRVYWEGGKWGRKHMFLLKADIQQDRPHDVTSHKIRSLEALQMWLQPATPTNTLCINRRVRCLCGRGRGTF